MINYVNSSGNPINVEDYILDFENTLENKSLEASIKYQEEILHNLKTERDAIEACIMDTRKEIENLELKKKNQELLEQIKELELEVKGLEKKVNSAQEKIKFVAEEPMKQTREVLTIPFEEGNTTYTVKIEEMPHDIYITTTGPLDTSSMERVSTRTHNGLTDLCVRFYDVICEETVSNDDFETYNKEVTIEEGARRLSAWMNRTFDPQTGEMWPKSEIIKTLDIKEVNPVGDTESHTRLFGCLPTRLDMSLEEDNITMIIAADKLKIIK